MLTSEKVCMFSRDKGGVGSRESTRRSSKCYYPEATASKQREKGKLKAAHVITIPKKHPDIDRPSYASLLYQKNEEVKNHWYVTNEILVIGKNRNKKQKLNNYSRCDFGA